jgi:hypothetical protein
MRVKLFIAAIFLLKALMVSTQAVESHGLVPVMSIRTGNNFLLEKMAGADSYSGDAELTGMTYDSRTCHGVCFQSREVTPRNAWRGLVPLRSTRNEVERVLKNPKNSSPPDYIYEADNENIIVRYSTDLCNRSGKVEWNVPVDTVITITVSPKAKLLVRDLHLDLRQYGRSEIAHPRGLVDYINLDDGVGIESKLEDGCEVVLSVTYQPTTNDKDLRCPATTASKKS